MKYDLKDAIKKAVESPEKWIELSEQAGMKLWAALEYAEEHPDANIQRRRERRPHSNSKNAVRIHQALRRALE